MWILTDKEIKKNPAQIWQKLEDEETIITEDGKPRALVFNIGEDIEEIIRLIRRVKAEQALKNMQLSSYENGISKLSEVDIEREIKASREKRKNEKRYRP